jgi:hypothetical protein
MGQTRAVSWIAVHAGQDHLLQFSRRSPVDALAEMIWNGLDAEADLVDVAIERSAIGGTDRDLQFVTRVTIRDNGHGISPEVANQAFPSLGDSWKKSLNGRTLNGKRPLHGRQGRGRFYAYSIGSRVSWRSTASNGTKASTQIVITGEQGRIDGFSISEATESSGPDGTIVTIEVEQGRVLGSLLKDDLPLQLAARLAPYLLGNSDVTVRVDGVKVDPAPLIDGKLVEEILDEVSGEDLHGLQTPRLLFVDWTDAMKAAPGIVLCNEAGMALVEIEKSSPPGNVKTSGYLRWEGWSELGPDLLLAQMQHASIVEAGVARLAKHVARRTGALTSSIVATLKQEKAYPYPDEIDDPIQEAERQLFDVIAVTARGPLRQSTQSQRKMTVRLFQLALQERPETLDLILAEALSLSKSEQEDLAELLQSSSLGSIVGAAAEITRRLDLLVTLRHVIYSPDVSDDMREVDQLHPLVRDNVWLFGETWRLSASEVGLTNALRAVLPDTAAIEADLVREGHKVLLPDGKRGRVDLVLQRTTMRDTDQDRLVVELKRPSVKLGQDELAQVRKYAHALSESPAAGPSKWTFWLVGADTDSVLDGELTQTDREWGHVIKTKKYDLHVTTWGRLLDNAERRFNFYREQLAYRASQDESIERVRRRHEELLPAERPSALSGDVDAD